MSSFKAIIGVEVHVELKTLSKMFCSCAAQYFGQEPNTHTCPVCLALPGALPVPNKKAIDWTINLGLALGCEIPKTAKFDRKNYFYPDLPKGYQISQYDQPFCVDGKLDLGQMGIIRVKRVHLEEDTGKLLHEDGKTLIDYNRAGVPLVEIVTEPDFTSSLQVKEFLQKLQQIIRYIGISEADMEKGQMRCEPTVNLDIDMDPSPVVTGAEASMGIGMEKRRAFTPLVEIKNINSFRFVQKAIDYEIARQYEDFLQNGTERKPGNKTTRGWNEEKNETYIQRGKEEASDYRYFPEPDIPPFQWTETEIRNSKFEISKMELPEAKIKRYVEELRLTEAVATILAGDQEKAGQIDRIFELGIKKGLVVKEIANLVVNKKVLIEGRSAEQVVEEILSKQKTFTVSEEEIRKIIDEIIEQNPKQVLEFKAGKNNLIEFFVGQVARLTKGTADLNIARKLLLEKLAN